MRQGKMRDRISFLVIEETQDSDGYNVTAEEDPFNKSFWCDVTFPLTGKETVEADSIRPRKNIQVKMRYQAGIEYNMFIVFNDERYNIETISPDPQYGNEYLIIKAYAGHNVN